MATKKFGVVSPFLTNRITGNSLSRADAIDAAAARDLANRYVPLSNKNSTANTRQYFSSTNDPYSYGYGGSRNYYNNSSTVPADNTFATPDVTSTPVTVNNVTKVGLDDATQYLSGALKSIQPQSPEVAPNRVLNANAFPGYSIRFAGGGLARKAIAEIEGVLSKLPKGSAASQAKVAREMEQVAADKAALYTADPISNKTGKDAIAQAKKTLAKQTPVLKIKPPSDNILNVRQSNFNHSKPIGNQTVKIDDLSGGVRLSDPSERKRVNELAEKISSPDGYISRIIVDQDNNVIEGQHRLEALRQLGVQDVPVYKIEDLEASMPVDKMEAAINSVGAIHPDHAHQLVGHALDHISEVGIDEARKMNYGKFQPHYDAALNAIQPKAKGGILHLAKGGVLHLAEGSQQFPVGKNYNTPVDGDIVPLKPVHPLADLVAKGTKGILDFATKPFGYENPPVEMVSNFFQLPSIPKTIENYAYGLPTTTGSGQTLKMSPDLEATVTNLAPMIGPSAKAVAKVTKKIAQEAAPIVSKKAVQALEKYGVNPNMYAAPEAPSFKDAVPQGMKMSQEGGKFVLYDASGNVFSKGDDAQAVIFRANKRLENEAANAAKTAKAETQVKVKDKKVPADNLGFYSPTQKAATNLKRKSGSGEVILSDIKKYPEVNSDEIQMSGLEDFLKGKENVTKEEVQAFMDENRPKITETEYAQGEGNFDDLTFDNGEVIDDTDWIGAMADDYIYDWDNVGHKSREEIADDILSAYEPEHRQQLMDSGEIDDLVTRQIEKYADQLATDIYYDNPYRRYQNDAGYEIVGNDEVGYSIRDPNGQPLRHRDAFDIETAEGYARDHAIENGDYSGGETKFHDYKLSGGDNYRELLIQTPNETNAAKVRALTDQYWEIDRQILEKNDQLYQKGINAHKLPSEQVPEHLNEVDALEKEVYELKKKQKEILDQREGVKGNDYHGSHWDEPNVVAHVRMDDRYDVEGKKVLYVDEAQSDWHQEGGEHGYKGKDAHMQEKKYRQELNNIQNQLEFNAVENEKALTKANETGDYNYSKEPEFAKRWQESEQLKARRDELYNLVREMEKKVPEGPYKDDWHDLALKRVMTYAAKNGYHRVAFSSSKPQVGRWGTESIAFEKIPVGSDPEKSQWLVSATGQRGGVAGHVDLEGEARARGILDQVPQKVVQTRDELRDIIRKIGSRWTDNKVDRVTNKTWKKMQAENIGVVEPRREGMEEFYDRTFSNSQKNFAKKYKGVFGTTEVFDGAPVQGSKRHPANVIDITPEMLKSLDAGIPMKEGGYVDTDRLMRMVDDHFDEHSYADGGEVTSNQPSDDLMALVDEHFLNEPVQFRKGGRAKYSLDANEPSRMGIAPYGLRYALSASEVPEAKGKGYFGEMRGLQGGVTEYSLDDRDLGAFPSVTPNQTKENIAGINREELSDSAVALARKYAAMRKKAGKSTFAQMDELRYPQPQD